MRSHPLPRPSHRVRSRFIRLLAAAGLGLAAFTPAASAAGRTGPTDVLLARAALAAIDADPQLRDVNLVVSVVDRIAVIGGPVPTEDARDRVERLLRRVPGIEEVKNRCFVQPATDPLTRAVAGRVSPRPPLTPALPGVVLHPSTRITLPLAPMEPDPTTVAAELPANQVTTLRPAAPVADPVLLAPVGNPAGAVVPVVKPVVAPVLPVTTTATTRPGDVLVAAAALRDADPRFARLTVELRAGTLVITGIVNQAADAWELAQALRRLPGVARVAVGAVGVR